MEVFLLTFLIFGLAIIGLALGVLFDNKVLKGSCGGLSAVPGLGKSDCSCANPCEKRLKREQQAREQASLNETFKTPVRREDIIEFKRRS